jgi:hypothetical protein
MSDDEARTARTENDEPEVEAHNRRHQMNEEAPEDETRREDDDDEVEGHHFRHH